MSKLLESLGVTMPPPRNIDEIESRPEWFKAYKDIADIMIKTYLLDGNFDEAFEKIEFIEKEGLYCIKEFIAIVLAHSPEQRKIVVEKDKIWQRNKRNRQLASDGAGLLGEVGGNVLRELGSLFQSEFKKWK
jgi:hypothetical protein